MNRYFYKATIGNFVNASEEAILTILLAYQNIMMAPMSI